MEILLTADDLQQIAAEVTRQLFAPDGLLHHLTQSQEARSAGATEPLLAVTEQEAARRLSVCQRTVFELERTGRLRSVRLGDRIKRYAVKDLQNLVHGNSDERHSKAKQVDR